MLFEIPVLLEIQLVARRDNPSSEMSALVHFDFTGGEERTIRLFGPTIVTD